MDKLKQMEERIDVFMTDDMTFSLKDLRENKVEVTINIGIMQGKTVLPYDVGDFKLRTMINRSIGRIYNKYIGEREELDGLKLSLIYSRYEAVINVKSNDDGRVIVKMRIPEFSVKCIEPLITLIDSANN